MNNTSAYKKSEVELKCQEQNNSLQVSLQQKTEYINTIQN